MKVVETFVSFSCFNPHPARKPDATWGPIAEQQFLAVSILTRPESRMLQCFLIDSVTDFYVSILTRPESRMLRVISPGVLDLENVSILTRPESRMLQERNSACEFLHSVSILTRPESRMLLCLS